jgi:nucleotide-binding universal stress UspA family protein
MKILIATDGLPPATHAIHEAAHLLASKGAEIVLVSVIDPELHTGGNQDAEDDVAKGLALLAEHRIEARGEVLRGHFAEAIIERAGAMHADVIVVGHERSGRLVKLLLGSVSSEVVRRARCAVLVVPHQSR